MLLPAEKKLRSANDVHSPVKTPLPFAPRNWNVCRRYALWSHRSLQRTCHRSSPRGSAPAIAPRRVACDGTSFCRPSRCPIVRLCHPSSPTMPARACVCTRACVRAVRVPVSTRVRKCASTCAWVHARRWASMGVCTSSCVGVCRREHKRAACVLAARACVRACVRVCVHACVPARARRTTPRMSRRGGAHA